MRRSRDVFGPKVRQGRPSLNLRRVIYGDRFNLTLRQRQAILIDRVLDKLDRCADDDARRVLLGIAE